MSFEISSYNAAHFSSFKEAERAGAVYSTDNELYSTDTRMLFTSITEMISMFTKLVNDDDLIFGTSKWGVFITIEEIDNFLCENLDYEPNEALSVLIMQKLKDNPPNIKVIKGARAGANGKILEIDDENYIYAMVDTKYNNQVKVILKSDEIAFL